MNREEFDENYADLVREIADLDKKNFNIFKVLGLTDYEIRHSNFLAWLFTKDQFFEKFINVYNKNINGIEKYSNIKKIASSIVKEKREIKREEHFKEKDPEGKEIGRYIDLNIVGDSFTLTIENKIDSEEHDNQCIAYRNYVEKTYSSKEHFYVYLAKDPSDFNSDINQEKFPGYVFIDYKQIRDKLNLILGDEKSKDIVFDGIQKEIVDHYIKIINEWETIPDDYVDKLKDIEDLSDFSDNKNYQELFKMKPELNQEERRFVELARRYYREVKKDVDKLILPAIQTASKDPCFIKGGYAGGSYGVAIPLSFDALKFDEKVEYLLNEIAYLKKKNEETLSSKERALIKKEADIKTVEENLKQSNGKEDSLIKKQIDSIIKEFTEGRDFISQDLWSFQTIDYRGPMDEWNNPSIGIFAGLSTEYSRKLCDFLIKNDFKEKFNDLNDWTIELKFYWKDGSGFNHNSKEAKLNFDSFKELESAERKKLLNSVHKNYSNNTQGIHGKKSACDVFNNNFVDYLIYLKDSKLLNDDFIVRIEEIIKYFTKESEVINASIKNIDYCFSKNNDYKDDFDKWKEENNITWNENKIKELFKDKEIDLKALRNAFEIAAIKKWIKKEKKTVDNMSVDKEKRIEIEKCNEKTFTDNFLKWISYNCCSVYLGWRFELKYQITDFEKIKNEKGKLVKRFIEKTIEGVKPFDEKQCEYGKWFKDYVFKEITS